MGFSKTTASWFSVLGREGNTKVEKLDESTMDSVEAMEQGLARTIARDEVKPEKAEAPQRKMTVVRSEDRLKYVLRNEDLAPILEAHSTPEGIQVFTAGENMKIAMDVPAFTLTHDKDKSNWKVASNYCERCSYCNPFNSCKNQGGQTLAFVRHAKESIGEGVAMCMDVDVPQVTSDGRSDVWCPICVGSDDARTELNSLRPTWNKKLNSLCMDFKGRVKVTSAKNFQLCLGDKAVLVYGKISEETFCLEYEHPLSTAQAFAIALTTMYWT